MNLFCKIVSNYFVCKKTSFIKSGTLKSVAQVVFIIYFFYLCQNLTIRQLFSFLFFRKIFYRIFMGIIFVDIYYLCFCNTLFSCVGDICVYYKFCIIQRLIYMSITFIVIFFHFLRVSLYHHERRSKAVYLYKYTNI